MGIEATAFAYFHFALLALLSFVLVTRSLNHKSGTFYCISTELTKLCCF